MRRTLKISLGIAICSLLLLTSNASAALPDLKKFYTILPTPAPQEKVKTFDFGQTPTTYFKFTDLKPNKNLELKWTWTWLDGAKEDPKLKFNSVWQSMGLFAGTYESQDSGIDSSNLAFSDWWSNNKKLGDWRVKLEWKNGNTGGYDNFKFSVAPEPVSSLLFLVGGVALGGRSLRRRFSV